ncbi:DUF155 domain-containing protein, partial [Acrasis kona]
MHMRRFVGLCLKRYNGVSTRRFINVNKISSPFIRRYHGVVEHHEHQHMIDNDEDVILKDKDVDFFDPIIEGNPNEPYLLNAYNLSRFFNLDVVYEMVQATPNSRVLERTKRSLLVRFQHETNLWYMNVYNFGSVGFFDCRNEEDQTHWLNKLREITDTQSSVEKHDNLPIILNPNLDKWCQLHQDKFILKNMDLNSLNIISGILCRSAALKSFEDTTQHILNAFQHLNAKIQITRTILKKEGTRLVPLIAESNALKCDLLINVRLLERPEISWNFEQYDQVLDVLNREFEIGERYQNVDKKLDFIQINTQFFMELQHSRKSENAENLIIILICVEVLLALLVS